MLKWFFALSIFHRDYMLMFKRHEPPDLEICLDSIEINDTFSDRISLDTINKALDFTTNAGAIWGDVKVTDCIFPVAAGDVRLRVDRGMYYSAPVAVTQWDTDKHGYVTWATVTFFLNDYMENEWVLSHEFLHANGGVGHICRIDKRDDGPWCDDRHGGNVMHPHASYIGPGIADVRWAIGRVYDK